MNSNESALENIATQLNACLEQMGDNRFIADVLCIWNCDRQDWLQCAPFVLRLEYGDITFWWEDEHHLRMSTEPIDAYSSEGLEAFLPAAANLQASSLCCLEWRQYSVLRSLIGARVESIVVAHGDNVESLHLQLDAGLSLQISPDAVVLQVARTSLRRPA